MQADDDFMFPILLLFAYFFAYLMGFVAQVLFEAAGSVKSQSNGLRSLKEWFELHAVDLLPRSIVALFLAPAAIIAVPDAGKLPVSVVYFVAGFSIDRIASSLLFINNKQKDTAANGNGKNGTDH